MYALSCLNFSIIGVLCLGKTLLSGKIKKTIKKLNLTNLPANHPQIWITEKKVIRAAYTCGYSHASQLLNQVTIIYPTILEYSTDQIIF